jgi:hypothetical protein
MNVKINRSGLKNPTAADGLMADLAAYAQEMNEIEQHIARLLQQRAQF